MERSLIWQLSAIEASIANSTAWRLSTGSGPGNPRHTGHTLVFGGLPNWVEQPQKILVLVRSWTWTSSPMTGSYLDCVATGDAGVVTISFDYNGGGLTLVASEIPAGIVRKTHSSQKQA